MLTQQPWVERCLQATDLTQAGVLAARYAPHVILVDGSLAETSGLERPPERVALQPPVVMTERQSVPSRC